MDLGRYTLLASGERFYIRHPEKSNYTIDDMALGMARQCRFNGQFARFPDKSYSIAQHSILVDDIVDRLIGDQEARPWAIIHDAPEGIIGDVIAPVKFFCEDFHGIEDRLQEDMLHRFNVYWDVTIGDIVHWADIAACAMEAEALSGFPASEWNLPAPPCSIYDMYPDFDVWGIEEARLRYLNRVRTLVSC